MAIPSRLNRELNRVRNKIVHDLEYVVLIADDDDALSSALLRQAEARDLDLRVVRAKRSLQHKMRIELIH